MRHAWHGCVGAVRAKVTGLSPSRLLNGLILFLATASADRSSFSKAIICAADSGAGGRRGVALRPTQNHEQGDAQQYRNQNGA